MCFSPEASFLAAGLLLPMGGYCLWKAWTRLPRFWGYAVVPLIFGVQQLGEGFLWLGLTRDWPDAIPLASRVFLFFALAWWPVWFAVAGACAVLSRGVRLVLVSWALVATGWFFWGYLPAVAALPEGPPFVAGHSIRYPYSDAIVFGGSQGWLIVLLYYLTAGVPLLLAGPALGVQRRMFAVPLILGLTSVLVAILAYAHAFTSVWCFFAALISMYCVYFFTTAPRDLPRR